MSAPEPTLAGSQTSTMPTESPTAAGILAAIRAAMSLPAMPPARLTCDDCTKLNERRAGLPLGGIALCPTCFAALRAHAADRDKGAALLGARGEVGDG